jgi:hypothetical protein
MNAKRALAETGEVALALLKVTAATSDWFPPLKSAAGGALHIAELVKVCMYTNSTCRVWTDLVMLGISIAAARLG